MPLGNSCCIDKVGEDYKYLNYFSEDKSIEKFLEQSVSLDNSLYDITNTQISTNNYVYENLESFRKQVYPSKDDVMQEDISKLYETFVSNIGSKHVGKKHVYENNTCLYTGEKKQI